MKKITLLLLPFVLLCSCDSRRNLGHDFYIKQVMTENHPDHWEKYRHSTDLYSRNTKINEASSVEISPSGRYALFESGSLGGIVLYDKTNNQRYRVVTEGIAPQVVSWDDNEKSLVLRYYGRNDKSKEETVVIERLSEVEPLKKENINE